MLESVTNLKKIRLIILLEATKLAPLFKIIFVENKGTLYLFTVFNLHKKHKD